MRKSILFADWRITLMFVFVYLVCPMFEADAAEPSEKCPDNYIAMNKSGVLLADSSCPSGYSSLPGDAVSCLVTNSSGVCIMYVPQDVSYTDSIGTYKYTSACEYTGVLYDGDITWTGDSDDGTSDSGTTEEESSSTSQGA